MGKNAKKNSDEQIYTIEGKKYAMINGGLIEVRQEVKKAAEKKLTTMDELVRITVGTDGDFAGKKMISIGFGKSTKAFMVDTPERIDFTLRKAERIVKLCKSMQK